MAIKAPTMAEMREKITLCKLVSTVDGELNRIESVVPVQEVWARVEARTTNVDVTAAGSRPEIHYIFTIRKQAIQCDCVQYKGKTLYLTKPYYDVDFKYIVIEAVEIV